MFIYHDVKTLLKNRLVFINVIAVGGPIKQQTTEMENGSNLQQSSGVLSAFPEEMKDV